VWNNYHSRHLNKPINGSLTELSYLTIKLGLASTDRFKTPLMTAWKTVLHFPTSYELTTIPYDRKVNATSGYDRLARSTVRRQCSVWYGTYRNRSAIGWGSYCGSLVTRSYGGTLRITALGELVVVWLQRCPKLVCRVVAAFALHKLLHARLPA